MDILTGRSLIALYYCANILLQGMVQKIRTNHEQSVLCKIMALSEFEIKKFEKIVREYIEKHRPPPHIRDEVDLSFRVKGQSVEIFEIRAMWNNPNEKIEESVAKARYAKSSDIWKIYWQRADLKWHSYEPDPEVKTLEEFLKVVERDETRFAYSSKKAPAPQREK